MTKSKYFDGPDTEDESDVDAPSTREASASVYSGSDAESAETLPEPEDESESEEEHTSEEEVKSKKRKRGGKNLTLKAKGLVETVVQTGRELWRQGVKAGLGPGKQVFIEKPKPRSDGGVKYIPHRIHPNTMLFLADLKKNNDREWLKMHDADYRTSLKDWESFVDSLTEKITEVDETIPELPPKDLTFRIYRDVRFSSDPTPYKPHFSAAWSRTGRKGPYAGYYVQIQPGGKSFVGSGLWCPEAAPLALLRRNIDRKPHQIRQVLVDPSMRKELFAGIGKDEKKAIKAFAAQNTEMALKTKPKGYDIDNPNIELLRLRNFTVGKKLDDAVVSGLDGLNSIIELISTMRPFVSRLASICIVSIRVLVVRLTSRLGHVSQQRRHAR